MPVRVIFRCQFCAAVPDAETRRSRDTERALLIGTLSAAPKWGLRP